MSLAALMLGSGRMVFNEGSSDAVFRSFRIMFLEGGIMNVL